MSQAFLGAVLVSTIFSLTLNVYLAGKLGVLEDFQSLEKDLKVSFQKSFLREEEGIKTAAEFHGENKIIDQEERPQIANKDNSIPLTGEGHQLAGLNCDAFGGPSEQTAQEMVYWEDIPSDNKFVSPFKQDFPQYLSFEPDGGGW